MNKGTQNSWQPFAGKRSISAAPMQFNTVIKHSPPPPPPLAFEYINISFGRELPSPRSHRKMFTYENRQPQSMPRSEIRKSHFPPLKIDKITMYCSVNKIGSDMIWVNGPPALAVTHLHFDWWANSHGFCLDILTELWGVVVHIKHHNEDFCQVILSLRIFCLYIEVVLGDVLCIQCGPWLSVNNPSRGMDQESENTIKRMMKLTSSSAPGNSTEERQGTFIQTQVF